MNRFRLLTVPYSLVALLLLFSVGCKHPEERPSSGQGILQTWGMPGATAFFVQLKSGRLHVKKSEGRRAVRREIELAPITEADLSRLWTAAAESDLALLPPEVMDGTRVRVEWIVNGIAKHKEGRVYSLGASAALKTLADEINRLLPEDFQVW